MDDHHRLDGVTLVGGEPRLDLLGCHRMAPVARHEIDGKA